MYMYVYILTNCIKRALYVLNERDRRTHGTRAAKASERDMVESK